VSVYFYAQTDPYWQVSNFAPFGVEMGGPWWPTVEHYFQAQKFGDAKYAEKLRRSSKPKQAKALGMTRDLPLRHNWEQVKDGIMRAAVAKKFQTHPAPRVVLLGTDNQTIVENAPMDAYWGCGPDGKGLNRLGES
jgi:ribA/ribD-fused uncharacterized protein